MNIFDTKAPKETPPSPLLAEHQLAFELLRECLRARAEYIVYGAFPLEIKLQLLRDLIGYANHETIGTITDERSLKKFAIWASDDKYAITRIGFLTKATQYLRIQLGDKRWSKLTIDVANGISVLSPSNSATFTFSDLNRSLQKPRPEIFQSDYWLVTAVMLFLDPTYYKELIMLESDLVKSIQKSELRV